MTAKPDPSSVQWIKLFEAVDPEVLEGIIDAGSVRDIAAGETLLVFGEANSYLYILLSGHISIHLSSADSEPIGVLGPGDTVGEMSVIDRGPVSAFAVAESHCQLLMLPDELLWALIRKSHAAACNLLGILSGRLRATNQMVLDHLQVEKAYSQYGNVDALTGLRNRHWLDKMLARQMERAGRSSRPLSVIMIDIDHFKSYNDRFGHLAGDRVIHMVAQVMLDNLRSTEMAARYGGDEFVVILPDVGLAGAKSAAERLRWHVMNAMAAEKDAGRPALTISLGVAQAKNGDAPTDVIAAADAALYRAKEKGRNVFSD